ncbi:type II secretion system protein [Blastopirellula marina]|uniref:UvrC family homology region profile domain-containing protein n=1 Tax=Blastopirellula marina TaxID=124 RepID=A0A2S8G146_9BACT|nr:prepilin-type N-terminal cleavage/methylation domain-containing protein [Blastopirellula marina]PQO38163.1 hypothetical protein C5Y98_08800 [Blastopirellula marina]PTL44819.1 prepilin-type N-terminal cleavage/methylation domain-containing protein [Blastopirellula marina]
MHSTARQNGRCPNRPAFTLVELLVVMGVLALMSSMVLVGLASAAEQARVARTRGQIQKIHELLMTRWDEYRYRRVEPSKSGSVRARQGARVDKIRELMRMEMPDRKEDFAYTNSGGSLVLASRVSLSQDPALYNRYKRQIIKQTGAADFNAALGSWSGAHASSECLYMILGSIQDGETNGLDYFKPSEIGDTDGDGMLEILDAWGKPIYFLRWPYGFPIVESIATSDGPRRDALTNLIDLNSTDPFDPLNVRGGASHPALYPLIFSAGTDGLYNIRMTIDKYQYGTQMMPDIDILCYSRLSNSPYVSDSDKSDPSETANPQDDRVGNIINADGGELDNISNHVLVISGNG